MGYSDGAYSDSRMSVMVALIGVRINYENEVVKRLKELAGMGVKSTVLIHRREEEEKDVTKDNFMINSKTNDEEEDYAKSICTEYVNRGWIAQEAEEMIDFPALKESGGEIRCSACYLSRCDCKDRVEELSNIQNFMSQI